MSITACGEKVFTVGTDISIFDLRSAADARIREYARLFEEYHVIIYTPPGFVPEAAPPLFLYPTNSRVYFLRPIDAFRIGRKIMRARGISLVSVQDPAETGLAGWLLKKSRGAKLHIQIHADFFSPFFRKNSIKEYARYLASRVIIPRGDKFRVVSQRIANSLHSALPTPPKQPLRLRRPGSIQRSAVTVLPIFVDRARIAATGPSFDLRKKYPQFDFIILTVSRLVREKNIGLAILAFKELKKEFPQSGLIIVGDGPEFHNLQLTIHNSQLTDNVRSEGWQNDLVSYYKGADMYLLTSNFEGYGRTVVEAVAAGCPVVMTDVGVAGEVIKDGETGRVVRVRNKKELVDALISSRRDHPQMEKMAKKAQGEVLDLQPRTHEEYLEMYHKSFS